MMSPFEAALAYVDRRNWPVFPVGGDKRPLIKNGFQNATRELDQIETWWRKWPDARIGVPTGSASGLVILDIDAKDERANGFDTLQALGRAILPETPMAHTPSGGLHVYFAAIDQEIRNSVGKHGLGIGLDVRGEGGYIIVPSPGSGYRWDPIYNLKTAALLPAPAWLGHRQRREMPQHYATRLDPTTILDRACDNIRLAANGERHDVLNREAYSIAGLVRGGALAERLALHQLEAATLEMAARTGGDRVKAARDLNDAWRDGLARAHR